MSRQEAVLDIECYRDYFLVMFRHVDKTSFRGFELYDGHPLDVKGIIRLLKKYTIVTFNGRNYDLPLLMYAFKPGVTNADLKRASDHIIQGNLKPWEFENQYGVSTHSKIDHIDLIEVAPGQASLKIYGGRLHCRRMQDLPYHFDDNIFEVDDYGDVDHSKREVVYKYCGNDLTTTIDLRAKLLKALDLRRVMSVEYGVDLRSKSDAQIAESVIRKRVEEIKKERVWRPKDTQNISFRYHAPEFLEYKTSNMVKVFQEVKAANFHVAQGKLLMPPALAKMLITIGTSTYKLGIGGLHSTESSIAHHADDEYLLSEEDVASYYPSIILGCELYPKHLGREFLAVYRTIYETRLRAKKSGDKVTDGALKIVLNGSFGKFGSQYSILFSPNLLIQTTITGQLALLMLIESLECAGISVVSANTDGVVIRCRRDMEETKMRIVRQWERRTGFNMDRTNYRSLYSRDVNNYIAIKLDGEAKLKGAFAEPGLQKNPTTQICVDAVVNLLVENESLEDTIDYCDDIRRFVAIKMVAGGGQQQARETLVDDWVEIADREWTRQGWIDDGSYRDRATVKRKSRPKPIYVGRDFNYLGKAVRFYYSTESPGPITYVKNGNKVGKSDGAMALMDLPDSLPNDIDYSWYLDESIQILRDIAAHDALGQYA